MWHSIEESDDLTVKGMFWPQLSYLQDGPSRLSLRTLPFLTSVILKFCLLVISRRERPAKDPLRLCCPFSSLQGAAQTARP